MFFLTSNPKSYCADDVNRKEQTTSPLNESAKDTSVTDRMWRDEQVSSDTWIKSITLLLFLSSGFLFVFNFLMYSEMVEFGQSFWDEDILVETGAAEFALN
jgi:hypothetical protein